MAVYVIGLVEDGLALFKGLSYSVGYGNYLSFIDVNYFPGIVLLGRVVKLFPCSK